MYACIAETDQEDPYLTNGSMVFHQRMGFQECGKLVHCGHKFNRWYNMMWMEKHINHHVENQPPVVPFPQLLTMIK